MQSIPEILTRGVEQVVPDPAGLAAVMNQKKIRVYLGIDPTGSLLTLGHAVVLRKLQQFAEAGHQVILLIGNGTVRIGDPTGKDSTRPMLTDEQINENFIHWREQAAKVLDFSMIEIRHNGDWLDKLTYADIVKLLAKTTIQQLLERDMFQERLKEGKPIHGHEIIYPLLQGYDSVVMEVDLELGGSDQLFNMLMGRTLVQEYNHAEKWVLTTPIINGTDGRKMSKSYGNFIALTENPIDMYGKLMRVADQEITTYLKLLTDMSLAEIQTIESGLASGENPMLAKKQLAKAITAWLHSPEAADQAEATFEATVQRKEVPDDVAVVRVAANMAALQLCQACMPEVSNSELKRLIQQGGVELVSSKRPLLDPVQQIDITSGEIVRIGKRRFFKLLVTT